MTGQARPPHRPAALTPRTVRGIMPVIEAQRASILVPHDHSHINQKRTPASRRRDELIYGVCQRALRP